MPRITTVPPSQSPGIVRRRSFTGRPSTRDPSEAGNQSTLVALSLLQVIAGMRGPATLTEIARRSQMAISRAYRYLTSLVQGRFLTYDPETGKYDLGLAVIELGIAAEARMDSVRLAGEVMKSLAEQTRLAAILCVWGSSGPTVIKWEAGTLDLAVHTREGLVLPVPITAVGRLFFAHLDDAEVGPVLERDLAEWNRGVAPAKRLTKEKLEVFKREALRYGIARSVGLRTPSIAGLAAPVFDRRNKMQMAISLIGFIGSFDTNFSGEPARALLDATRKLSRLLGADPMATRGNS